MNKRKQQTVPSHIKRSTGERVFQSFNVLFMLILIVVMVYPLVYVVFASFSNAFELIGHRGILWRPLSFTTEAYRMMAKNPMILRGYLNTIFVVVVGVALNIILTSFGAYVLSRRDVMFKNTIMMLIVFTMYFSGGMIPFYFTVCQLGMENSLWSLIIPSAVNTFNLIIMRTSFLSIPYELEESAKLDGAGHYSILFRIVLPLSKAVVAVMLLYYAVQHWNSWFNANLFLSERKLFPLQLILREILIQNDTSSMTTNIMSEDQMAIGETVKYAVTVVATLPILCIYPFVQKYFEAGVMIGAVKG